MLGRYTLPSTTIGGKSATLPQIEVQVGDWGRNYVYMCDRRRTQKNLECTTAIHPLDWRWLSCCSRGRILHWASLVSERTPSLIARRLTQNSPTIVHTTINPHRSLITTHSSWRICRPPSSTIDHQLTQQNDNQWVSRQWEIMNRSTRSNVWMVCWRPYLQKIDQRDSRVQSCSVLSALMFPKLPLTSRVMITLRESKRREWR